MFFFQAEDGIRGLVRSRGLGDVYKRQSQQFVEGKRFDHVVISAGVQPGDAIRHRIARRQHCLLYTSDAADERSSVDLGGRRIIKKKKIAVHAGSGSTHKDE